MKRIRINYIHVGKIISNLSNVCKTALRQHIGNTIESLRVVSEYAVSDYHAQLRAT